MVMVPLSQQALVLRIGKIRDSVPDGQPPMLLWRCDEFQISGLLAVANCFAFKLRAPVDISIECPSQLLAGTLRVPD